MAKKLDELTDPMLYAKESRWWKWIKDIARDADKRILRSLGYRLMIEKIIIDKWNNKMHVLFYEDVAKILWLKKRMVNIQTPRG